MAVNRVYSPASESEPRPAWFRLRDRLESLHGHAVAHSEALIVWGGVALVIVTPLLGLALGLALWGWPNG